jgi:hypothetical protein
VLRLRQGWHDRCLPASERSDHGGGQTSRRLGVAVLVDMMPSGGFDML